MTRSELGFHTVTVMSLSLVSYDVIPDDVEDDAMVDVTVSLDVRSLQSGTGQNTQSGWEPNICSQVMISLNT
jgi:hypothetical protein